MNTIGIIAEFNPFHKGHEHLIQKAKEMTSADYAVVVMSGDFVQRGAPAIISKFDRAKMALSCGADIVLELPVSYSTGSAEFFANGAVSILDGIGAVDSLAFGSESGDIDSLKHIASLLSDESPEFKSIISKELKSGKSYADARQTALKDFLSPDQLSVLSEPNNILGIEYIKALERLNSSIVPVTIQRIGENYHSAELSELASATGIRNSLLSDGDIEGVLDSLPGEVSEILKGYKGKLVCEDDLSEFLYYKLVSESERGYDSYLDVTSDLSNKIKNNLDEFRDFESFCMKLKTKDLAYTRISRCLIHILLDIKQEDTVPVYARILGFKKNASEVMAKISDNSRIPVINKLSNAESLLNSDQMRLFNKTLIASRLYNRLADNGISNEFTLKHLVY